jgi:glycosyltransferase involved in cell wall biosynthesis
MARKIRVLNLTTHNEECGIARYQEQFVAGMKKASDIEHEFFDVSPNVSRFMSKQEYEKVLEKFIPMLERCDVLHIQHELSFYKHRELQSVISAARQRGKRVLVTIHTALDVEYKIAQFHGLSKQGIRQFLAEKKAQKKFEYVHLNPLKRADLIIVHNNTTKDSLHAHGFDQARIKVIKMPVPKLSFALKSQELKKALDVRAGDIVFCTVGFITRSKGTEQAVQALVNLPDKYKLAIIGGLHPRGGDTGLLDEIQSFIASNELESRVYITGFIEDDDRLNALIREVDMCVYPYDSQYYSYVSSAALSNALANHKPVVAYPTKTISEINQEEQVVTFCKETNPKGLADTLQAVDIVEGEKRAALYAKKHAYDKESLQFADIYRSLV